MNGNLLLNSAAILQFRHPSRCRLPLLTNCRRLRISLKGRAFFSDITFNFDISIQGNVEQRGSQFQSPTDLIAMPLAVDFVSAPSNGSCSCNNPLYPIVTANSVDEEKLDTQDPQRRNCISRRCIFETR